MIISMTGFANRTLLITKSGGIRTNITMTLKTLNSRFFEVTCKLPTALQNLETEFIKRFKESLYRGHTVFTVHLSNPALFKGQVQADLSLVKNYVDAIESIKKTYSFPDKLTLHDLLQLSNIFVAEEGSLEPETVEKIMQAVDELIDQLVNDRAREGKALEQDLKKRCSLMQSEIANIEKAAELAMQTRKARITKKLTEAEQQPTEIAEQQRSLLYFELDKIDINEEIVRFKSHLKNFIQQLESSEIEKGRRLDFILQELAREINTITAKCADASISSLAINVKVEIEKAREQVQNIV